MSAAVFYPDCLILSLQVENTFTIPDPLWPGIAFALFFILGGAIGGALAKPIINSWQRKMLEDEEEATVKAQGVPMHMRGGSRPGTAVQTNNGISKDDRAKMEILDSNRSISPSGVSINETLPSTFSYALSQPTESGVLAEIARQDVQDFESVEENLRTSRSDTFLALLSINLSKCIEEQKLAQEEVDQFMAEIKKDCGEIIALCKSEQASAEQARKLNELEIDVARRLERFYSLNETDIRSLMMNLTHQLAIWEKKWFDEAQRQIQGLEEKLAQRRTYAELNQMKKGSLMEKIEVKVQQLQTTVNSLLDERKIMESQKKEVQKECLKAVKSVLESTMQEAKEQEKQLLEQQEQRRKSRKNKWFSASKKELEKKRNALTQASSTVAIDEYFNVKKNQATQLQEIEAELDSKEAEQVAQLWDSLAQASKLTQIDALFEETLRVKASINPEEIARIMKLHRAEMLEFDKSREVARKKAQRKLDEKRETRRQQKSQEAAQEQQTFHIVRQQQQNILRKVVESQAELTDEAIKQIMEDHKRSMDALSNQLHMSKIRQEKQLEERLALRAAKRAEQVQQKEISNLLDFEKSEKEKLLEAAKVEEGRRALEQEREASLQALTEHLLEETQQALLEQEARISQLIGQLEVGRARRKHILEKQSKLLTELQSQLANKIGDSPKGYATTTEILQKHESQVKNLTEKVQHNKERQEQLLQDQLEKKKLRKEADIREKMKEEAQQELQNMRARGAGQASSILLNMMLEQRHQRAMEDLELQMKAEMQRLRDQINDELTSDLMAALSDQGKSFMANLAATSDLTNGDLTEALQNAASSMNANNDIVKNLSKELRTRVKTAKGQRS